MASTRKGRVSPHTTYPLRRIVRREVQGGRRMVVMACQHAVPGVPASRFSRFYPCSVCYQAVQTFKRARAAR